MTGCVASKVPQESRRTSKVVPSEPVIQLYHGNASLLAESLEVIQQTASVILAALEPPIADEATDDELAEVAA